MDRVVLAGGIAAVVFLIAFVLQRRRPSAPTQAQSQLPAQLDRADFVDPQKPWLVAVFSSDVCDSCPKAVSVAQLLESGEVAFQNVSLQSAPALHDRYTVLQVPLILVADREGIVRLTYTGPPNSAELWAEFAHVREHVSA